MILSDLIPAIGAFVDHHELVTEILQKFPKSLLEEVWAVEAPNRHEIRFLRKIGDVTLKFTIFNPNKVSFSYYGNGLNLIASFAANTPEKIDMGLLPWTYLCYLATAVKNKG